MEKKYSEGPWEWRSDNVLWSVSDNDSVLESDDDGKPYGSHAVLIEHHWDWDVKEGGHTILVSEYEHNVPGGWSIVWRHESRKDIRNKEGVQERTVEILMCPN